MYLSTYIIECISVTKCGRLPKNLILVDWTKKLGLTVMNKSIGLSKVKLNVAYVKGIKVSFNHICITSSVRSIPNINLKALLHQNFTSIINTVLSIRLKLLFSNKCLPLLFVKEASLSCSYYYVYKVTATLFNTYQYYNW